MRFTVGRRAEDVRRAVFRAAVGFVVVVLRLAVFFATVFRAVVFRAVLFRFVAALRVEAVFLAVVLRADKRFAAAFRAVVFLPAGFFAAERFATVRWAAFFGAFLAVFFAAGARFAAFFAALRREREVFATALRAVVFALVDFAFTRFLAAGFLADFVAILITLVT